MITMPTEQTYNVADLIAAYPQVADLVALKESVWFNPDLKPTAAALPDTGFAVADVDAAADRLKRFAPYLAQAFPKAGALAGIIESPFVAAPNLHPALAARYGRELPGQLWLKLDNELPISGSIKARGGIHEVLKHAEDLALEAGLLRLEDDYRKLDTPAMRKFFAQYKVAVGSTGNLGLSIGIMSARLGFQAAVHMSADARQWKKDKLRSHGVRVVEHASDYSVAVAQGRAQAASDPTIYFVDDENSVSLFLGYAVAARRLAGQMQAYDVRIGADRPLFVYLPCGVGGGPGGVAFGLKTVFGDNVHCLVAEPTHSPCMYLGLYTGLHDEISVQDIGIDNVTAADGLAVGRASGFVGQRLEHLLDGCFTVADDELFRLIAMLDQTENIHVEPSAAAGLPGPWWVMEAAEYRERIGLDDKALSRAIHVSWLTGGSMVPQPEMASYVAKGAELLAN
jgi:D-serine dehydratase